MKQVDVLSLLSCSLSTAFLRLLDDLDEAALRTNPGSFPSPRIYRMSACWVNYAYIYTIVRPVQQYLRRHAMLLSAAGNVARFINRE
jgi:hypothetical protein